MQGGESTDVYKCREDIVKSQKKKFSGTATWKNLLQYSSSSFLAVHFLKLPYIFEIRKSLFSNNNEMYLQSAVDLTRNKKSPSITSFALRLCLFPPFFFCVTE